MIVLKVFGAMAALFVALIAAYIAYYLYANNRAESTANQFCNAVTAGAAVSDIRARAEAAGSRYFGGGTSNSHKVFFQGAPFNGFYCNLTVVDGKVASRQVTKAED